MRWWWVVLALTACETQETRAWEQRRGSLERRRVELLALTPTADGELRSSIDLAARVRERALPARVFAQPGRLEVQVRGTAEQCHTVVTALADLRWLVPEWWLRLDGARCDWRASSTEDYLALEQALLIPSPRWVPPDERFISRSFVGTQDRVAELTDEVRALEERLGDTPALRVAGPLVAAMRARAPPCEEAVLARELALEPERRGALLELSRERLVHPLEPHGDFRLRGLVRSDGGTLTWRCLQQ